MNIQTQTNQTNQTSQIIRLKFRSHNGNLIIVNDPHTYYIFYYNSKQFKAKKYQYKAQKTT